MISRPRSVTRPYLLLAALAAIGAASWSCSRGRSGAKPAGSAAAADGAAGLLTSACPTQASAPPPVEAGRLIDDFASGGGAPLEGRTRTGAGFSVREQFQATPAARFDPPPGVDAACGGAAHVKGTPADTGATFALVFSGGGATGLVQPGARFYDASGTKGITFRAALGNARASRHHTVQVTLVDSGYSYNSDFVVDGTAWRRFDVPWSELSAVAGAPPFSPARLNQIVFLFASGAPVDLYLDDLAFLQ